jgi:hypothetical protein
MDASLKRLLALSKKTGHPLIVMGEEESFVLLSPDRYEELFEGKSDSPEKKERLAPVEKKRESEPPLPPPPPDLESETQFYLEPVE